MKLNSLRVFMHRNGRTFPKILIILRECYVFAFACLSLALFTHPIINNQMKRDNDISTADVFSFLFFRFTLSIIYLASYCIICNVYCVFLDFIITFFFVFSFFLLRIPMRSLRLSNKTQHYLLAYTAVFAVSFCISSFIFHFRFSLHSSTLDMLLPYIDSM